MDKEEEKRLQVAFQILEKVAAELKLTQEIEEVQYRPDHMDYFVVLGSTHFCQIRQKLIEEYLKNDKNADILKEIRFRLQNPTEFEDWEKEDRSASSGPKPQGPISVDDSDKVN